MDNKTAWEILENIKDLPTLPSVYFKVHDLLQDKDVSIESVARVIEIDPAMSTKILRLVNSAFYGLQTQSRSIGHAVMVLGFNAVKNAIVSVAVIDTLSVKNRLENFNIADFWRHSVSVAVLTRQLAEKSRLVAPEDAFIAGLLHDIGKIIMLKYFEEDLRSVLKVMQDRHCRFEDAEMDAAYLDHVQIGAYLARKWRLPEPVIEAIAGHHYFITSEKSSGLVECLMAANALANNNFTLEPGELVFDDHIEKALNPLLTQTGDWLPQARDEIAAAGKFFLEKEF